MSVTFFGEWEVPSYRGGDTRFDLAVGENDGNILLSLAPAGVVGDEAQEAFLDLRQARELIEALNQAMVRAEG